MELNKIKITEEEVKQRAIEIAAKKVADFVLDKYFGYSRAIPGFSALEAERIFKEVFTSKEQAEIRNKIRKEVLDALERIDYMEVVEDTVRKITKEEIREMVKRILADVLEEVKERL